MDVWNENLKPFHEMNKEEKIFFLRKRYDHCMKCFCELCLEEANKSLDKLKKIEVED